MSPVDEIQPNVNDRRSFIKLLAAAPLLATIGTRSLASTVASAGQKHVFQQRIHSAGSSSVNQCAWHLDLSLRLAGAARDAASDRGSVSLFCRHV